MFYVQNEGHRVRVLPGQHRSAQSLINALSNYFLSDKSGDVRIVGFEHDDILYPPSIVLKCPRAVQNLTLNLFLDPPQLTEYKEDENEEFFSPEIAYKPVQSSPVPAAARKQPQRRWNAKSNASVDHHEALQILSDDDCPRLYAIHERFSEACVSISDLTSAFDYCSGGSGLIDQQSFISCMEWLGVLKPDQQSVESRLIRSSFMTLFTYFDFDHDYRVDSFELLTAVALFTDSQEPTRLAFTLFDEDRDGFIDHHQLYHYFRTNLLVMFSMNEKFWSFDRKQILDFAHRSASETSSTCFQVADADQDGYLSFFEFEEFILQYPQYVPWIHFVN